ncbi:MAG: DNA polymerase III subunit [Lachnospiraceae bacterium]|nr:DNA polymerase III subunit delta [Clostridiales bacterium]MDD6293466.1 DNA polymerase III subunit [Eubacteriales bacterium]MDY2608078.1 DNA polymerase III subunit [Lachnospiraceae bacterium]
MAGLDDILGNEHIVAHFKKAIENNKISHAYIINGEKGIGKRTVAKAFAMTLLCEEKGTVPCMKCHSCVQALTDNNPDLITITPDKPTTLSIDHIRQTLVNDVELKPYSNSHKVYIVEDAELMNNAAQNAILKTIEEPPEYAVIILLTTNISALLQTVLSRCVKLDMQPLKKEVVKKYLMEKEKVVDYQADIAVSFAGGNLGKAIELSKSQDFAEMLDEVIQLLRYIKDMQAYEVVAAVKRASDYKFRFTDYIDLMILWFRDVLVYKASQNVNELIFKDEIQTIKEHAAKSSYNGIEQILEAMDKAKLRLKANVNFDVAIEMMFLTIRDNI